MKKANHQDTISYLRIPMLCIAFLLSIAVESYIVNLINFSFFNIKHLIPYYMIGVLMSFDFIKNDPIAKREKFPLFVAFACGLFTFFIFPGYVLSKINIFFGRQIIQDE